LNHEQIDFYVSRSLMLVTALSPVIGYDKSASIAHYATDHDLTLEEAAIASGYIDKLEFEKLVNLAKMVSG